MKPQTTWFVEAELESRKARTMSVEASIFAIGSSSSLALALSIYQPTTLFLGRSNPHDFAKWIHIPGQETKSGIKKTVKVLEQQLLLASSFPEKEIHLICLQGLSDKNWEASVNVNLISPAMLSSCFCTFLADKNMRGTITLIASASSYIGGKDTYASTKAALFGLMNSIQSKHSNVRVNIVLPGAFDGAMTADWPESKKSKIGGLANAKRIATSDEIAHAINFCIENQYISQSIINMTSGRVIIS